MQYLYVIRVREYVNSNQNIYKIGKTKQEPHKRMAGYPKDSELYLTVCVDNCDLKEKELIKQCKERFAIRHDIGDEYFQGDVKEIMKLIFQLSDSWNPSKPPSKDVLIDLMIEAAELWLDVRKILLSSGLMQLIDYRIESRRQFRGIERKIENLLTSNVFNVDTAKTFRDFALMVKPSLFTYIKGITDSDIEEITVIANTYGTLVNINNIIKFMELNENLVKEATCKRFLVRYNIENTVSVNYSNIDQFTRYFRKDFTEICDDDIVFLNQEFRYLFAIYPKSAEYIKKKINSGNNIELCSCYVIDMKNQLDVLRRITASSETFKKVKQRTEVIIYTSGKSAIFKLVNSSFTDSIDLQVI
jgi:hypothetical protein